MKRVDIYDMGKTAVAMVNVAGRDQELVCDLPGASKEDTLIVAVGCSRNP